MNTHTPPPEELAYKTALHEEHHLLETVDIPIITISATHRDKLADTFHESFPETGEVVLSRAHYSMAIAILVAAYDAGLTAWLVDPINYVTPDDWQKVIFTESVGKLMARHKPLKEFKDLIDARARSKLPITPAIEKPLRYLAEKIQKPIISLHYEAGNILARAGHQVIQVVTDPHVRSQYLDALPEKSTPGTFSTTSDNTSPNPPPHTTYNIQNTTFCVFDEATKTELLLKAETLGKDLKPDQVIVTGPPIDPRIAVASRQKNPDRLDSQPLRLAITTSGIGTNRAEIAKVLDQLHTVCIAAKKGCVQLFLYAGTHQDFHQLYQEFAAINDLKIGALSDDTAPLRVLYADNLVEANELMIQYMFTWADGIITKPSGDMAYDAAAAGCFTLFLEPWGEWEVAIQERFEDLGIGQKLDIGHFQDQLTRFEAHFWEGQSWFRSAMKKALTLPDLYRTGASAIILAQQSA
jgi:hypothetical protein